MGLVAAVAGASGYAGGELLRLLAAHPDLEIGAVTGHGTAGHRVGDVHPGLSDLADLPLLPTGPDSLSGADLVFLALPHGLSGPLAAALPDAARVVDLGADHRLADPGGYRTYYGGAHPGTWTYGLPELPGQRGRIAASTRVANTGCHAAAVILALAPLIAADLVEPDDIVVVSASGTSGAGRSPAVRLLASEVMGDLTPYRVGEHQHVPEIHQATGARDVTFTPVLAPLPRGILATVTARPRRDLDAATLRHALTDAYQDEPFVRVLPDDQWPRTAATLGSNSCHLRATLDRDSGRVISVAALDNLGKGAAGQAVQCANLMLGLPETAGLTVNGLTP